MCGGLNAKGDYRKSLSQQPLRAPNSHDKDLDVDGRTTHIAAKDMTLQRFSKIFLEKRRPDLAGGDI